MNKYIVEAIGTFALTLAVGLSLAGEFSVSTAMLAAVTVGLFVYTIGNISGAHLNPGITIAAWTIKKISTEDGIGYIIAQFFGAAVALTLIAKTVGMPTVTASNDIMIGVAELIGAFFFAFGIASVMYGEVSNKIGGIVIGGSLLLGGALAILMGANGLLNPALALGVGSFNLMYIIGPIIGAVAGMQAYKYIRA